MIFTIKYVASVFQRSFKALFSSTKAFLLFALIAVINQAVLGNKAVIEDGLSMFPTAPTLLYKTLPNLWIVGQAFFKNYPGLLVLAGVLGSIYLFGSALYTIAVIRNIALVHGRNWNGLLDGLASASPTDLWWLLLLRLFIYTVVATIAVLIYGIAYERWMNYGQDLSSFLIAAYLIVLPFYSSAMWLGTVLSSFSLPIPHRIRLFKSVVTSRYIIALYFFFLFQILTSLVFFIAIPWISTLFSQGAIIPIGSLCIGLVVGNMFRLSGYELVANMIKSTMQKTRPALQHDLG